MLFLSTKTIQDYLTPIDIKFPVIYNKRKYCTNIIITTELMNHKRTKFKKGEKDGWS